MQSEQSSPQICQHQVVKARVSVLECAGPQALSGVHSPAKSSRGLEHSETLTPQILSRITHPPEKQACAARHMLNGEKEGAVGFDFDRF